GYASTLRILKRRQAWSEAQEVFRGEYKDTSVTPRVLYDGDGKLKATFAVRRVGFFQAEFNLLDGGKTVKLPLPERATLRGYVDGALVFTLQEPWGRFTTGALIALDL